MRIFPALRAFACLAFLALLAAPALAGGGPETTLLVVNAESASSLRVANAYVQLRDIPASHVLYLEDVPGAPVIGIDAFRGRILAPIQTYLATSGLDDDIETIAYSTGFPYGVNFDEDTRAAGLEVRAPISRTASLTGLTYLYRHVGARAPAAYLGMTVNRYYRGGLRAAMGGAADAVSPAERELMDAAAGAMRSKSFRRAAETYRKLVAAYPDRAEHWYNLACALALTGEDAEALEALATSVEKGFTDAVHTAKDRDLETLRKKDRFREILDGMREKAAASGGDASEVDVSSRAFRSDVAWTEGGEPDAEAGDDTPHRYRMAVMLGWTGAQGNSVPEVLRSLERAAASDATFPEGTVYLMVNKDVRARARMPLFPSTADALKRLGRKAVILEQGKSGQDGKIPLGKNDVLGLVAGTASFRWPRGVDDLLPGAIAEHLTSFGAHFGTPGQTKCTEFVRHGAAGTSGTVAEPYAIPMKFPSPFVHVHYARGCSLAEAFYQSVWGPYQLLVLGDPLTRPFTRFAEVALEAPSTTEPWSGRAAVRARITPAPGHATARTELWVDGRRVAAGAPDDPLAWDTSSVPDGAHEIRLVAIDAGPVATRSYAKARVQVVNGEASVSLNGPGRPLELDGTTKLTGSATGAAEVAILQGSRELATAPLKAGRFKLSIPGARLGVGETSLVAVARTKEGDVLAVSAPTKVEVRLPTALHAPMLFDESRARPGLRAVLTDASGVEHEALLPSLGARPGRTLAHDLKVLGVNKPKALRADGALRVPAGIHEIEVTAYAPVTLTIGGRSLLDAKEPGPSGRHVVTVGLAEGWHEIRVLCEGDRVEQLGLTIGGAHPTRALAGDVLAHAPANRAPARPPTDARPAGQDDAAAGLLDGERGGKGTPVEAEGLVVTWKRSQRNVLGVVVYAERGKDAPAFPKAWVVETRSSTRGKWKPVRNARVLVCPGPEVPRKGKEPPLRYVEVVFDKTSARQLRVRPEGDGTSARVTEVEIDVKGK